MKKQIRYFLKLAACAAVFLLVADVKVSAQGMSLFQSGTGSDKKRSGKVPTVINSDVMDIDVAKNIAVFTGNVKVDDEEMTITCKKMTIFFEDKKQDDKKDAVKKPASGDAAGKPSEESKQISRIICEENVVIIRKPSNEGEKGQGEQKSLSGHADYDVKTGKIVLTKDPVIMRDEDTLKGEVIVIFRDSEKIEVHNGGEIRLGSDTVGNIPKDGDGKKAPEKKDDAGRTAGDNEQKP